MPPRSLPVDPDGAGNRHAFEIEEGLASIGQGRRGEIMAIDGFPLIGTFVEMVEGELMQAVGQVDSLPAFGRKTLIQPGFVQGGIAEAPA